MINNISVNANNVNKKVYKNEIYIFRKNFYVYFKMSIALINKIAYIPCMAPLRMIRLKREEIARLRVLRGIRSEAELARTIKVHPVSFNRMLREGNSGGIKLQTLDKLCRALQCAPGELLEYRPDP